LRRACLALALAVAAACARPQPPVDADIRSEVPIDEYLVLLERIAPSAREGAEVYMTAFRLRCGRALTTIELRRALTIGSGDPTLIGMIRAAYAGDAAELRRLSSALSCPRS
jgi:hypothetical protein